MINNSFFRTDFFYHITIMKRIYQSGAQKRQEKKIKDAEAAKCSLQLSSWLTQPRQTEPKLDSNGTSQGKLNYL